MVMLIEMAFSKILAWVYILGGLGLCLWLVKMAWEDFWQLRIKNETVLFFSVAVLLLMSIAPFEISWSAQLRAAIKLFAAGFLAWWIGALGAGDVKLLFPIGIVIGWNALLYFVVWLWIATFFFVLSMLVIRRFSLGESEFGSRIIWFASANRIPFIVPIAFATLTTFLTQVYFMFSGGY